MQQTPPLQVHLLVLAKLHHSLQPVQKNINPSPILRTLPHLGWLKSVSIFVVGASLGYALSLAI